MILDGVINLSEKNEKVFIQRGAKKIKDSEFIKIDKYDFE